MTKAHEILKAAQKRKQNALSEYESKMLLSAYGIPVVKDALARDWNEARESALDIGYPVVLKVSSPEVAHKTEKGLIETDLKNEIDLERAFHRLNERAKGLDGDFLVQKMIKNTRELVIGMTRDPQFGPCVMFGLGGIFTEVLHDVSFRVAPIEKRDALEMVREIRGYEILQAIRGMEAVDLDVLSESIIALGRIGLEHPVVQEIDVNPIMVQEGQPVAVDALVVLKEVGSDLSE